MQGNDSLEPRKPIKKITFYQNWYYKKYQAALSSRDTQFED